MKSVYTGIPNGYLETIQKGIAGVRRFGNGISRGNGTRQENLDRLKKEIETADAIVIGAGAGLSTAAGFTYSGERFEKWFSDFREAYGFQDMYSGGFYPFPEKEIFWAYWARYIYINRYLDPPKTIYQDLYELVMYILFPLNSEMLLSSVQFSRSVVSNSLRPHELQHARPPCPSPTPRVHSDSHPSSQ